MTLEEILKRARAAYSNGVKPVRYADTGYVNEDLVVCLRNNEGCALYAAIAGMKVSSRYDNIIIDMLGITEGQAQAFVCGFDNRNYYTIEPENEAWREAGKSLAKEYFKE